MKLQVFLVLVFISFVLSYNLPTVQELQNTERMLKSSDEELSQMVDKISSALQSEYNHFLNTGVESRSLKDLTYILGNAHSSNMMRNEVENMEVRDKIVMCTLCRSTMTVMVRTVRNDELEKEQYKEFVMYLCDVFKIYSRNVCEGLFELNFPIIHHIVKSTNITAYDICGVMLQASFCSHGISPSFNFTVNINSSLEAPNDHKFKISDPSEHDITILQLTDIHYDALYMPGSLAKCEQPLCCREGSGTTNNKTLQAGYWTDYRDCDIPRHMIVDCYKHINKTHKNIDYIYFTGDVADHSVWETTREYITEGLLDQYKLVSSSFPGYTLYPLVGNHESHPANLFASINVVEENFTTMWLYNILADVWVDEFNLPEETKETIKKGGYYSVSPRKGFRVIAFNNNDCYTFNWWLFYEPKYLAEPLQWLADTLQAAEENDEKVHLLAHIPSGSGSCWHVWSREYVKIIERYRDTISAIFNGHTHYDEMNNFYSVKDHYAINVGWNGGSLTPFTNTNPNYRIYTCDPTEMQVLDHETWIFNLTEANIHGEAKRPRWYKEYNFRDFFKLKDLSPKSINDLYEKFARDPELLLKYHHLKRNMADPSLAEPCDHGCLKKDLCNLAVTHFKNQKKCKELQAIYDETIETTTETSLSPTTKPSKRTKPTKATTDSSSQDKTTEQTSSSTSTTLIITTCNPSDPGCRDGAISLTFLPLSLIFNFLFALEIIY